MSTGAAMQTIIGGDVTVPPPVTYGQPRPKQKGLDWAAISLSESPLAVVRCYLCGSELVDGRDCETCAEREAAHQAIESRQTHTVVETVAPTDQSSRRYSPNSAAPRAEDKRPEIVEDIRRLYYDDMRTTIETATELGVSPNTVSRVMERNGMEPRRGGEARQAAVRRISARLAGLGVTSLEVRQWARSVGVPVPKRGFIGETAVELYAAAHS